MSDFHGIILTTIDYVPGKQIVKHLGLVSGSTVRTRFFGKDILAAIKNTFGGELKTYTKLLEESRKESVERMVKQAEELGANAIINIRFENTNITSGAAEIYAYGTAVVLE